jgi:hypothetical protein
VWARRGNIAFFDLIGGRRAEKLQLPCFADWKTERRIKRREGSNSETSGEIEWRAPVEQQWPIHTVEKIRLRERIKKIRMTGGSHLLMMDQLMGHT